MKKVSPHATSGAPASLDPISTSTPSNSEAIWRRMDSSFILSPSSTTLTLTLRARRGQDALLALNLCSRKRARDTWSGEGYLVLPGNAVVLSPICVRDREVSLSLA